MMNDDTKPITIKEYNDYAFFFERCYGVEPTWDNMSWYRYLSDSERVKAMSEVCDGLARKPVQDLVEGDSVDLDGISYFKTSREDQWDYEYAVIAGVEQETLECVKVMIEGVDHFGVPTGLLIPYLVDNT